MNAPKHLGIILDGNRRFAKRLMLEPWKGHEQGANKFKQFTEWAFKLGISEITAYVFSIQNFNRPKEEYEYIIKIFKEEITELLQPEKLKELDDKGTRIRFIGRLTMLPTEIQELQNKLMKATENNTEKRINFAMAYGGREEIIDAVKQITREAIQGKLKPEQITEQEIQKHLWLSSEPELIIRTGGEQRTSNFLPWQSTYSELKFINKLWPEIEEQDLKDTITEYCDRDRRFGR